MDGKASPKPKTLCSDSLLAGARACLERIPDGRRQPTYALVDCLMAGVAMFHLKDPSLLAFQGRRGDANLRALYGLQAVPSDTQMRQTLDGVDPDALRPAFRALFRAVQRAKGLEELVFFDGSYLIALDGSEYFCSEAVHCENCLRRAAKGGQTAYYHQALAAALVHPDHREVIPLAPEPIQRQDGQTKNDCERNAARRWLEKFRADHPRLRAVVTEDGLASNGPHIRDLQRHGLRFILGAKEADHAALRRDVLDACAQSQAHSHTVREGLVTHRFLYVNGVPLNDSHPDLLVNYLEYWEQGPQGEQHFSWVTDLPLTRATVRAVMRGGRARWRIENETFNTLKNQGYAFEHNFGHGRQHLCAVFAALMLLAFLIDQVQQRFNQTFRRAWKTAGSKRALWERVRGLFQNFLLPSMEAVYAAIAYGLERQPLAVARYPNTS